MKRILYIAGLLLLGVTDVSAQNVEAQILINGSSTPGSTIVDFRIRTKVGTQFYVGVSMYFVYQEANLAPLTTVNNNPTGVSDAMLTTTFGWGTGIRTITPFQSITPVDYEGQIYNRRYVYINADETGGSNVQTLTTSWVTLFSVTFNNLQAVFPHGGYGRLQETSQFALASITDENGVNVPIDVTIGNLQLGPAIPTPVTFTAYDVACNDKGTMVTWTTGSEVNASHYEIERSINGANNWLKIDEVAAAGNSSNIRNYQYLDLQGGDAFYRLKQVDIDGRFIYTAIKHVNCEGKKGGVVLFPVPTNNVLNVAISHDKAVRTELQIVDMSGRIVKRQAVVINNGNTNFTLDVSTLAMGEYMLTSSDKTILLNKKFTIAR